jgi:hypothetical protein
MSVIRAIRVIRGESLLRGSVVQKNQNTFEKGNLCPRVLLSGQNGQTKTKIKAKERKTKHEKANQQQEPESPNEHQGR